jgi:multidrug efflux pump subunit AcrA (membrane-fusion protein)
MKKLAEIKKELDSTNTRISELETELTRQTATFEATQAAFIADKANLDELHAEQSKLTLLAQAIESLEATANELHSTFNEVTATETRTALIESAKAAAHQAEKLWTEAHTHRLELDDAIGKFAEIYLDKLLLFRAKQKDYMRLRGQVQPNQTLGLSDELVRLLENNHLNFSPIRFGLAVHHTIEKIENEREKQEIAKSRAAR